MPKEFLKIVELENKPGNYQVFNLKGILIGFINYYHQWRKYVFTAYNGPILDIVCMKQIIDFIEKL